MTLQEAFNIADNLVRMQQLEIERLREQNKELDLGMKESTTKIFDQIAELSRKTDEAEDLKTGFSRIHQLEIQECNATLHENSELKAEIERLKEENFNYSEVQVQLKWAKETNSELLSEIERLKRYELEYKKREWDEAILYNNLFKASMLVAELANALKSAHDTALIPGNKEAYELIRKANEITYQPKDPNAVGNIEH